MSGSHGYGIGRQTEKEDNSNALVVSEKRDAIRRIVVPDLLASHSNTSRNKNLAIPKMRTQLL